MCRRPVIRRDKGLERECRHAVLDAIPAGHDVARKARVDSTESTSQAVTAHDQRSGHVASPVSAWTWCHNDGMSRRVVRTVLIIAGVVTGATLIGRRLGYNLGTNTIVRCRQGHLFTTIWFPGVKLKELDLVVARVQRCPVGKHWSLVVPVREAHLTEEERQFAREHHDIRIP